MYNTTNCVYLGITTMPYLMKKHLLISILCFFSFVNTIEAQTLRFKVIHSDNFQGIAHVEIKSSFDRIFYTDSSGHFEIQYKDHDTLTLSKEHYHTIFYLIEAKNFDPAHTITLSMTAAPKDEKVNTNDIKSLQSFEYHFIHDQDPSTNYLKIHVMEHTPGANVRKKNPQEFKIGSVPLNHHSSINHSKTGTKSQYNLK